MVLLGGPAGLGERLREIGVARRVSVALPGADKADAVVLLADATCEPEAGAAALAPGGVLYLEVDRRRSGRRLLTPAAVERRLRQAGLTVIGRHWVLPGFHRARRFLPLDAPGALDWFLTTLQPAKTLAAHLGVRGLQWIGAGETARIAPWVPCYAITATLGEPGLPALLARPELPGGGMPAGTRTALLTSGEDDGSRVVLLPFAPGARTPEIAIKASRSEGFNAHTEREQATLRRLRERLGKDTEASVPAPLGCFRHGASVVGIESVAPGRAMSVTSGRWGASHAEAIGDLRAATDWLANFHARAAVGPCWSAERAAATARRIEEYAARLRPSSVLEGLFQRAGERAAAMTGRPLPIVWLHNDYGPWNIYRQGARLTVIDWEFGEEDESARHGPALCDLIYFVTVWGARVWHLPPAGGEAAALRRFFVVPTPDDEIARAVHGALDDYMRRLGIDSRFLPLLLVHTWLERALDRSDRRGTSAPNPYAECLEALAPAAERLFR